MFISSACKRDLALSSCNKTFAQSDWETLSAFWHPVALESEIGDSPLSVTLLDAPLVVYRSEGKLAAALDRCPHRGVKLSLGFMGEERLTCPMHGLQFDSEGICTKIPAAGEDAIQIPSVLNLQTFATMQRFGIVWVCLAQKPLLNAPDWNCMDGKILGFAPPEIWNASAPRHVENFNDVTHFPFVHRATFAADKSQAVPPIRIVETQAGLRFDYAYREEGHNRFPDPEGEGLTSRDVIYRYDLALPFTTLLEVDVQNSTYSSYFLDAVCPVSAHVSKIFQVFTDTTGAPDIAYWTEDAKNINREDRALVESHDPQDLPLHQQDEPHLPGDQFAMAYRRTLARRFGLGGARPESE